MKKSVYSLVLMDDVVEAVDRLAYSMNTSRSNLINQILAEKVCCITPEKRMRDIFETIESIMANECYQIQNHQSDAMLSIKSSIRYRYRPTVRYCVELYRNPENYLGTLKVSFRTQSVQLINAATEFFNLWNETEEVHLGSLFPDGIPCKTENGRYIRKFSAKSSTEQDTGTAIAEYIKVMDKCLKLYFSEESDSKIAELTDSIYNSYLKGNNLII